MIFGNPILGGFGILRSNMSQVQTVLLFQGCNKIVLRLHTAGTENPYTPKHIRVPPISMNTTQIPPDTHQTSPRHPLYLSRERDMPTDNNRRQQTPPDLLKQHLSVSWGVRGCLFVSVVVCWHLMLSGEVWRVSGGYLVGVWRYPSGIHGDRRHSDVFRGVSGFSVLAVWSHNALLAQP